MLGHMPVASLRSLLAGPAPVALAWLNSPDPLIAEAIVRSGFDAVALDLQHGAIDAGEALRLLQVIGGAGLPAVVRVPWSEPAAIMKALDLGAWGVIAPMLQGPADVRALVSACLFPPAGQRSYGPTRGAALLGADYAARANEEVVPIAMIETRGALEGLDEILATPGLGGVFVGPADLSQALGGPPGVDYEEGPVPAALARIADRCAAHGLPAGLYTRSARYARRMLELGYRFVVVGSPIQYVEQGAAEVLRLLRSNREA
jgi:4-hydroxy-2-oxoheptanedioate aldolase